MDKRNFSILEINCDLKAEQKIFLISYVEYKKHYINSGALSINQASIETFSIPKHAALRNDKNGSSFTS